MKSSHEKVKVSRGPKRAGALPARARPVGLPGVARERPRVPKRAARADGTTGTTGTTAARALTGRAALRTRPTEAEDAGGSWSLASEAARGTAAAIAAAAIEKKAIAVEILDVAGKVDYADFLVIMTGRSDRHAQALAQGIEDALRVKSVRPVAVEGLPSGTWVLMDFGDVVVHVFQEEARQLYDIEGLWLDAQRLPVPAPERST
ncbi:MAG TPA: ribosome silencing factor [Polyangiaceae bacterium]|jgi:ribosome-associated protein|nr:ribosome silencing factor [Polyangiaceae bacterium]